MLERNIVLSRCLDVESLCIRAGEKVWCIRVDVNVLNYEGNILDCANIAVLCSLAHFKLPEVTFTDDNRLKILKPEERNPNKLNLIHYPLTITFALFEQGNYVLIDPLELEEKCCDGRFIIGMNKHREVCMMQLSGNVLMLKDQVI
jgi:exosome complex component RRP45